MCIRDSPSSLHPRAACCREKERDLRVRRPVRAQQSSAFAHLCVCTPTSSLHLGCSAAGANRDRAVDEGQRRPGLGHRWQFGVPRASVDLQGRKSAGLDPVAAEADGRLKGLREEGGQAEGERQAEAEAEADQGQED
eukprot:8512361-Alexandrium_andersonii.AAC.1